MAGRGAAGPRVDGVDRLGRMMGAGGMDAADAGLRAVPPLRRGLAMDLPMGGGLRVGTVVRGFSEQRGRDKKQDCKRQEGRKWSVQPHHVLRGAERQSNSYLRESLSIV